jgi:hypothetical protein
MEETEKKSPHAPGQLLGFSLQITECVRRLLDADAGSAVSVEVFDDVGEESASGAKLAIQTKSAVSSGNPIADHSVDLWKTFANWIRSAKSGDLDLSNTKFEIRTFQPKSGDLAASFSRAANHQDALAALRRARERLWGSAPDYPEKRNVGKALKEHLNTVFDADETIVVGIISNFTLSAGGGCSRVDLEQLIATKWAPEEFLGEVIDKCLGWVKAKIEAALEKNEPAVIKTDDFNRELSSFINKLRFQGMLYDFASQNVLPALESHRLMPYVRQLDIIAADEEDILSAINSFLRSIANRTAWAERGFVWSDSFEEFEKALTAFWKNTKLQQNLDHSSESPIARGQRLWIECMKHRSLLQGHAVPDDFTPGSYHSIANELTIGWHPDYKAELKKHTES